MSTGGESCLSPDRSLRRLGFVRDSDCSVDRGSPGIIGWLGMVGVVVGLVFGFKVPFVSDNGRVCRIISIYFFSSCHACSFGSSSATDLFGLRVCEGCSESPLN